VPLVATAVITVAASAMGYDLGFLTFASGCLSTIAILMLERKGPAGILRNISWNVLPLVAGLFVVVEALENTRLIRGLAWELSTLAPIYPNTIGAEAGMLVAAISNVVNNLPAGLIAGGAVHAAQVSDEVAGASLIGVYLGPNLSVTGSLAKILWLSALRREGLEMNSWAFLKLGTVVMIPALTFSLLVLSLR